MSFLDKEGLTLVIQKLSSIMNDKLNKNLGVENKSKILSVDDTGDVSPINQISPLLLTEDEEHRFVTDIEKNAWNSNNGLTAITNTELEQLIEGS